MASIPNTYIKPVIESLRSLKRKRNWQSRATKDSKGKHDSEAWTKARKALEPYFRDAAASETPESGDGGKSMPAEKQKDSTPKPSESKPEPESNPNQSLTKTEEKTEESEED
jgi:hypothetical protein